MSGVGLKHQLVMVRMLDRQEGREGGREGSSHHADRYLCGRMKTCRRDFEGTGGGGGRGGGRVRGLLLILSMRKIQINTVVSRVSARSHGRLNLTRDFGLHGHLPGIKNPICLYRSCYSGPSKCGTWALTREWALAQDTTVYPCIQDHTCSDKKMQYQKLKVQCVA